jgi:hypothetical protein
MKQLFRSFFIFFAGVTFFIKPLVFPLRAAQAEEVKEIMVEGVGVVIQDDQSMARDRAIEDALRKAVEQAVGTLVESETRVRNYQILSDDIYSRSTGYVQSYQIVNELLSENILKITIKAFVSIGSLSEDLKAVGILLKRLDKPRVMVLIEEKNNALDKDTPLHQTEDTLIQMLSEKSFSFVDRQIVRQMSDEKKAKLAQSENIKAATSFGIQQGAELLIIGKAVVEKTKKSLSKMLGPMGSYRATVSLRAIKTETGSLLALANGSGVAVHINPLTGGNEAVKKAARQASEQLMNGLISRLNQEVGGVLSVQLVITGLNDQLLVALKNDLKSRIRGVQDIHQRFFGAGVVNLDVDIKGTAQMLADELTRKKFFKYNLSMVSYSPNRIELQLIPKDSLP